MPVIENRLAEIQRLSLKVGSHSPNSPNLAFCVMEAVAYVAGEPWSDSPKCACPVISAFMRSWNDALPTDADRDRLLKPLIPKLVDTKASAEVENRRATMACDWLVRVHMPAWLRLAGFNAQADALASLPEITDFANCPALKGPLEAAKRDAYDAGAPAWNAVSDAVRAAALVAAWNAARVAARDAVWVAARAAALVAVSAALSPTIGNLQLSAVDLVERMIAVE